MQRMIRIEQELEGVEFVVPHLDVKLKTCRRTRNRFFKAVVKKGLVDILPGGSAREHVGIFVCEESRQGEAPPHH